MRRVSTPRRRGFAGLLPLNHPVGRRFWRDDAAGAKPAYGALAAH
jgi:hypothetical protein